MRTQTQCRGRGVFWGSMHLFPGWLEGVGESQGPELVGWAGSHQEGSVCALT